MSNELSRRQILLMSALAVATFSAVGRTIEAAEAAGTEVDAGSVDDYAKDGVFDQFAGQGFFIIRMDGRIIAQSSICTHQRGRLVPGPGGFVCKKHSAGFAMDGKVTRPPAKADLVRYGIRTDDRKHLIVDMSKRVERSKFDTPGAVAVASI